MTITVSFHIAQEWASNYIHENNTGASMQTNGDIIVGSQNDPGSGIVQQEFWGSSNDGVSWAKRSELIGQLNDPTSRCGNLPGNVLLYAANDINTNKARIYRSTDNARSWSLVHDFNPGGLQNKLYVVNGIITYNRNSAIAYGLLAYTVNEGFNSQIARSTNGGVTWTVEAGNTLASMNGNLRQGAAGGNGVMTVAHNPAGLFKSTNNGATWTGPLSLPPITEAVSTVVSTSTWVTDTIVLAAGQNSSITTPFRPALWRSTDAGSTWTLIPTSSVEDYPTSAGQTQFYEIHRLTKEGAILSWKTAAKNGSPPWRYSTDAGLTWKKPSAPGLDWTTWVPSGSGAMVVTRSGKIIAPLPVAKTGSTKHTLWLGTINC